MDFPFVTKCDGASTCVPEWGVSTNFESSQPSPASIVRMRSLENGGTPGIGRSTYSPPSKILIS